MSAQDDTQLDVLSRLCDNTFDVKLTVNGTDIALRCRELPFSRFTATLAALGSAFGDEIVSSSRSIAVHIAEATEIVQRMSQEKDESRITFEHLVPLLSTAIPLLISGVERVPGLLDKVLLDCIVDARDEHIRRLPMDVGVAVLREVFERLDTEYVAEQLTAVFSKAASVRTAIREIRGVPTNGAASGSDPN